MSSTRYADEDCELRPDRYGSSIEYSGAINAHLAAKRIELIDDPAMRELLWFVQSRSLQSRGLKNLANELVTRFPGRLATPGMLRLRIKRGQRLTTTQIIELRQEFPLGSDAFILRGETRGIDAMLGRAWDECDHDFPSTYTADAFFNEVANAVRSLPEYLVRLCCDPQSKSGGVWYFDNLLGALREYRSALIKAAEARIAATEVSRLINDALEFSYRRRQLMLIEGAAGIGKTETAKAWCDRFPGVARYVEVPSSNDDRSFYIAIADVLGVAQGESYNTQQVKLRVEKTLRLSGIMLVLDEAQFLWPQVVTPRGIPARMQWIKTMFDAGVPIALVGLPDFTAWKEKYVRKTLWNGDQLDGRLNYPLRLQLNHSLDDLKAIARAKHPTGDSATWKILAGFALSLSRTEPQERSKPDLLPAKNARAIGAVVERASFIAEKSGRLQVTKEDIKAAIRVEFPDFDFGNSLARQTGTEIPLSESSAQPLQRARKTPAEPVQMPFGRRTQRKFMSLTSAG